MTRDGRPPAKRETGRNSSDEGTSDARVTPADSVDLERLVVVFFEDEVSIVTLGKLARDCGIPVEEAAHAINDLIRTGFLTPRPDGTLQATIPEEYAHVLEDGADDAE